MRKTTQSQGHSFDQEKYLGLPRAEPGDIGISAKRLVRIRWALRSYLESNKIPGLLTVIARRGEVAHFESQGLADVETGTLTQPHERGAGLHFFLGARTVRDDLANGPE